jgi:CO/xanthine dehydrogenase Mo-binding subunit
LIRAWRARLSQDAGAFGPDDAAALDLTLATTPYAVPVIHASHELTFSTRRPSEHISEAAHDRLRYALETQLDELGARLGISGEVLRRRNLDVEQPAAEILDECFEQIVVRSAFGLRRGKLGLGRGLGLACSSHSCIVAQVQVEVDTGAAEAVKLWIAAPVAKHEQQRLAMSVRDAVRGAFADEVRWRDSIALNQSWNSYHHPVAMPEIEFVPLSALLPVHELAVQMPAAVAAAIANALADAIGSRVTEIPFTPERVLQAVRIKHPVTSASVAAVPSEAKA